MMSEDRSLNPKSEPVSDRYKIEYSQDEIDDMMGLNDDCPYCEDGFVWECFDGQCLDAEIGCDLCAKPCEFCS